MMGLRRGRKPLTPVQAYPAAHLMAVCETANPGRGKTLKKKNIQKKKKGRGKGGEKLVQRT